MRCILSAYPASFLKMGLRYISSDIHSPFSLRYMFCMTARQCGVISYRRAFPAPWLRHICIHPLSIRRLRRFLSHENRVWYSSNFLTVKYPSEKRNSSMSISVMLRLCLTISHRRTTRQYFMKSFLYSACL